MRKDLLARAFFGVMIVALGGILLLQNLDIIKFNNWGIFWGIFWGSAFILAGLSAIFSKRECFHRFAFALFMASRPLTARIPSGAWGSSGTSLFVPVPAGRKLL